MTEVTLTVQRTAFTSHKDEAEPLVNTRKGEWRKKHSLQKSRTHFILIISQAITIVIKGSLLVVEQKYHNIL